MSVTLMREEEEHQRQHPRYRIPVSVELDGWVYPAQEWSIDGFSIAGVHNAEKLESPLPVKFIFRFDGFSTNVDLKANIVHRHEPDKRLVCRFHNPSNQQLAILRAVIDAYLAGEFVLMGDLIYVVRQDRAVAKREDNAVDDASLATRLKRRLRRIVGLTALTGLFLGLLGFTVWVAYQRIYVVEGLAAVVSAPIVVIRAPQPSYFEPVDLNGQERLTQGEPLAYMELIGGGATTIDSPCDCTVLDYHALPRQFVGLGEPVATLLPEGAKPFLNVQFAAQTASKIALGDPALIRLSDGSELPGKVSRIRYGDSLERRLAAPLNTPPTQIIGYTEVSVEPDGELTLDLLGTPAAVTIDTFRGLPWTTISPPFSLSAEQ